MRIYPIANPFLALRPFSRQDAARFYGRDADLVLIRSRLYSSKTTLLFAGSGVGKTSLIDARLTPTLESRWSIVTHRRWAARPPLEALSAAIDGPEAAPEPATTRSPLSLLDALERRGRAAGTPRQHLLILDQFEEVFQHWRDSQALDEFVQALSDVVHSARLDARVLFSMREEFLGELSVFDNLIPDLFNNCYRLKNPTRAEAEEIIEKTAHSEQKVECGDGFDALLDDLLSAPRGVSAIAGDVAASARSRIPMPFLQIVCHRLWEKQLGRAHGTLAPFAAKFVESHKPGTAAAELDAYCREKLEALTPEQRDSAAAAFGFLMTPAGAKMAYPVDVLATQARVPEAPLLEMLRKLSEPEVRILREIPGGRGSKPWFELYHDLYARFLSDWKRAHEEARTREQQAERERQVAARVRHEIDSGAQQRRRQRFVQLGKLSPVFAIAGAILLSIVSDYFYYYRPLRQFAVDAAIVPDPDGYAAASTALAELKRGWAFGPWGRWWWSRYWQQRAQREMWSGATDRAILSQTRALQESDDEEWRRQLRSWLGFGEIVRTFRAPEPIKSIGYLPLANRVYGLAEGCRIVFWDRETAAPLPTWSPAKQQPCTSIAAISPNAVYAAIVGTADVQDLSVTLMELQSNRVIWTTRGSSFMRVDASFSRDGKTMVGQAGGRASLVSTTDGAARPIDLPRTAGIDAATAEFRHSPFSDTVIVRSAAKLIVLPTAGSGPSAEANLTETAGNGLIPLAGDAFALVSQGQAAVRQANGAIRGAVAPDSGRFDAAAATTAGDYLFVRQSGDQIVSKEPTGLCRVSVGAPTCERHAWPLGDYFDAFVAVDAETILAAEISGQAVREIKLAKIAAPPPQRNDGFPILAWSPDGRWLVTTDGPGCSIVDLDGNGKPRPLSAKCAPGQYVFNQTGRLLGELVDGGTVTVIDTSTLDRRRLSQRMSTIEWASGEYLTLANADGTRSLLNVMSGVVDPIAPALKDAFHLAAAPVPNVNCLPGPLPLESGLHLSPDARHAALSEQSGLVLYQKSSGSWSSRKAIPNAAAPCEVRFSADSSRMLALLNGSVISVWTTGDGTGVRSLTDRFQPLGSVSFGFDRNWVAAASGLLNASDLVLWRLDGSEEPAFRIPLPGVNPMVLTHPSIASLGVAAGRMVAWLSPSGSQGIAAAVRPVPWQPGGFWSPVLMADGRIRQLIEGTAWSAVTIDSRFSDVAPVALPASKSWSDVQNDWSKRLDARLDDKTGLYVPVTAVSQPAQTPR